MAANQLNDPAVFPALKTTSHHGLPPLSISEEEIIALAAPFEFALVGKFSGRRPVRNWINKFLFNLKLIGDFSMTVLDPRHVLIKLIGPDKLGYIQHIEMEAFLPFCDHCKSLGHSKINCHILHPHLDKVHLNISKLGFDGTVATSDNMLNVPIVHDATVSVQEPLGSFDPTVMPEKLDNSNKLSITTTVTPFFKKQKLMTNVNVENACLIKSK
ncbi:hypothetical protein M5K25_004465 [Dendrobium thyrsiflorum]|uniref:DUF4283 domain-containing protein n=1 Tax=Dendrobium thyrsiflorum TaxID=117978 RepID=A0ABD0VLR6_DENTH